MSPYIIRFLFLLIIKFRLIIFKKLQEVSGPT